MIIIKDMKEKPKNCAECPLTYPRWDFNIGCKVCKAILGHHENYGKYETERHPDCPLVEIVNCKDCKYYYQDEDLRGYHCERDNNVRFSVYKDFYCAGGKRRE